jgi:hypothetical protein
MSSYYSFELPAENNGKLVDRQIRDKILGLYPQSDTYFTTKQVSPIKIHCTM